LGGKVIISYKTAFIVNPKAGRGKTLKVWSMLEPILQAAGQPYRVYYTRFRGDGTNIAEQVRANGAELIVGIGGDGTLLEVINGLDLKKNIFGIIPAGTGNGFRRSMKIPGNCHQAFLGLSQWEPQKIDLGTINGMYFLNVVGFGFDAAVAKQATIDNKVLKGYPAFVSAAFSKLATFGSFPSTVSHDTHTLEEKKTFLAVISNGRYYGGQLCIAPQAKLNDGKLDLCMVRKVDPFTTTVIGLKAFFEKHLGHKALYIAACEDVNIQADESIPVHIDGEVLGSLPAKIGVVPGALQILAPQLD
jgi:diacylglycerol kinase (ATP)